MTGKPYLGRCADCDYALFANAEEINEADNGFKSVVAGGPPMVVHGKVWARCPSKHKVFGMRQIKGTYSKDHKCDARCMGAKGHECTCACGGMNHGRGHAITVSMVNPMVEKMTPDVLTSATPNQIKYIESLIAKKLTGDALESTLHRLAEGLTKQLASTWIDRLKGM